MNRDQMNAAFGVTDEQLDSLAADYEAGDWKGRLGPVVQGRPRLYEEEMKTIFSAYLLRVYRPSMRMLSVTARAGRSFFAKPLMMPFSLVRRLVVALFCVGPGGG